MLLVGDFDDGDDDDYGGGAHSGWWRRRQLGRQRKQGPDRPEPPTTLNNMKTTTTIPKKKYPTHIANQWRVCHKHDANNTTKWHLSSAVAPGGPGHASGSGKACSCSAGGPVPGRTADPVTTSQRLTSRRLPSLGQRRLSRVTTMALEQGYCWKSLALWVPRRMTLDCLFLHQTTRSSLGRKPIDSYRSLTSLNCSCQNSRMLRLFQRYQRSSFPGPQVRYRMAQDPRSWCWVSSVEGLREEDRDVEAEVGTRQAWSPKRKGTRIRRTLTRECGVRL